LLRLVKKYFKNNFPVFLVLIFSLCVKNLSAESIVMRWTAPGDDDYIGTATQYDVRYATFSIDDGNWATATQVMDEPVPDMAGSIDSIQIDDLASNTTYWFAMKTADEMINWSVLSNVTNYTTLISEDVAEEKESQLPEHLFLEQNYPNPFNPSTKISYELPKRMSVRLEIYNLLGQKIKTLVDVTRSAGTYSEIWNGTDSDGRQVVSGLYLYRLFAGDLSVSKKMLLLK